MVRIHASLTGANVRGSQRWKLHSEGRGRWQTIDDKLELARLHDGQWPLELSEMCGEADPLTRAPPSNFQS
jgi:hypothetical protein